MSMMTTAYLLETYGARLTVEEIAEVLRLAPATVRNRLSAGTLGLRTYNDGDRRFADALDVACHDSLLCNSLHKCCASGA